MNRILTLLCFLFPFISNSQTGNFNTLFLQQPQFFQGFSNSSDQFGTPSFFKVMHFHTSVNQGSETDFSGFRSIRTGTFVGACIDSAGRSWFGSDAIDLGGGSQKYFNQYNEPILIETQAVVNQNWFMYSFSNGDHLQATVTSVNSGSMFNVSDQSKLITLNRIDINGNTISDPVNGKVFIISRDSGWIQLVDFFNFPVDTATISRIPAFQLPTIGNFYDFQPGDIFQYFSNCYVWGQGSTPGAYEEDEILSRQDFPIGDSISYSVQKKVMSFYLNVNPTPHIDTVFTQSVISQSYFNVSNPLFNQWPEESILDYTDPNFHKLYNYGLTIPSGNCLGQLSLNYTTGVLIKAAQDSCYPFPFEPITMTSNLSPGFGLTYVDNNEMSIVGPDCSKTLIWSFKNGVACGTHASLTNIVELSPKKSFSLSPNPAENSVTIHTQSTLDYTLRIFAFDGRLVHQQEYTGNSNTVSVSAFPNGFYFFEIEQNGNKAYQKVEVNR